MTGQRRAQPGGEHGANGEWYKGGQFVATTDHAKRTRETRTPTGRQEIEPYKWETPPTPDHFAILKIVGSVARYRDQRAGVGSGIEPFAPGVAYFGETFRGHLVADLCERFNAGERWAENR